MNPVGYTEVTQCILHPLDYMAYFLEQIWSLSVSACCLNDVNMMGLGFDPIRPGMLKKISKSIVFVCKQ